MAIVWFRQDEAVKIIDALTVRDIHIRMEKAHGLDSFHKADHFVWALNDEDISRRLDVIIDKSVSEEVGFTFADASEDDRERWIRAYEAIPSVEAVLMAKFGDPMVFWGRGLEGAQAAFRADPNYPIRMRDKSIA